MLETATMTINYEDFTRLKQGHDNCESMIKEINDCFEMVHSRYVGHVSAEKMVLDTKKLIAFAKKRSSYPQLWLNTTTIKGEVTA